MIPGEIIVAKDVPSLDANVGLETRTLIVANTGDRPIQVGSHYHFFETNSALAFDRAAARGFRLNIPAGTAVRFEAGDSKEIELVALAGLREVYGLQGKINGPLEVAPVSRQPKKAPRQSSAVKRPDSDNRKARIKNRK